MSRIICALLLSLLIQPALRSQQTASPEVMGLEEAVALALQNNRPLRIANLEVEKLDENLSALRTRRLPEFHVSALASSLLTPLSFAFEQGVFGTYPVIGPIPAAKTDITTPRRLTLLTDNWIRQPLSQLYKINLSLRMQELSRDIGKQDLRAKQHAVRNQVTRVYYNIVQTQAALDASTQAVEFYRELDRVTDQYLLQEVVLRADSLDVKMRLAREKLETVKLQHQVETQQEQLNQLLGRDIRRRFRVAGTSAPSLIELDLGVAQARALKQRPELRQAELKKQQAEYDRRRTKAEYIPDVSFAVQQASFANIEMLPSNAVSAGLYLNWEPFDWGRKRHELAEKSKAIAQAEAAWHETESEILRDLNEQFRKVQESAASLAVAELAVVAAKEKLRVTNNAYRVQAVRLDRVLEAETTVSTAASQYQRALSNYWTARSDLEKATGED
jgi:outer membrane protein TolC